VITTAILRHLSCDNKSNMKAFKPLFTSTTERAAATTVCKFSSISLQFSDNYRSLACKCLVRRDDRRLLLHIRVPSHSQWAVNFSPISVYGIRTDVRSSSPRASIAMDKAYRLCP